MTASAGLTNAAARGFEALVDVGLARVSTAGDRWADRTETISYGDGRDRRVTVTIDPIEGELLIRVSAPGLPPESALGDLLPGDVVRALRLTRLPKLTTGVLTARLQGVAEALVRELPELRQ